jgi:hypothetical protein
MMLYILLLVVIVAESYVSYRLYQENRAFGQLLGDNKNVTFK